MGNRKELEMLLIKNDNECKKICIWKDEIPFNYVSQDALNLCFNSGSANWYVGTICMEVKLHARHVSNYAMICMRYTNNKETGTDVIINFGRSDISFSSFVLPFNQDVHIGLDEEFANAIDDFFKECSLEKLPSGTIEILNGGYDEVGSSQMTFKKAMELLCFIFQHVNALDENELLRLV